MNDLQSLLHAVLAQPTAPFHEDAVRGEILMQLAQCPHVTAERDDFGNVIATYRRGEATAPRYAFAAHMDHPGYVGDEFLGGVPEQWRANGKRREFGAFAMWDLPACEIIDDTVYSRACDDLIGCVAILAMFRSLEKGAVETTVQGIFTRAEEVGFIGAIHLAKSGRLPKDVTIVSLETSSEKGGLARMGEGVVIRVGDRTAIFDDMATSVLTQLAIEHQIRHQRKLMSGGTCEATAYQLYGYRTAALCVALGNYHNCAPDHKIASEYVSLDDVSGMIHLMTLAASDPTGSDAHALLRDRLEARASTYARHF